MCIKKEREEERERNNGECGSDKNKFFLVHWTTLIHHTPPPLSYFFKYIYTLLFQARESIQSLDLLITLSFLKVSTYIYTCYETNRHTLLLIIYIITHECLCKHLAVTFGCLAQKSYNDISCCV